MTRLLSAADFKREIDELRGLLVEEQRLQREEPTFSGTLAISTLQSRLSSLEAELNSLSDVALTGHEISVILDGDAVSGHQVEVDVMGRVLLALQSLVTAIVAGASKHAPRTGPYPEAIRRASTLRFAGSFAGSFGMRLEAIQDQPELDGFVPLAPTISTVMALVNTPGEGDDLHDLLLSTGERARQRFQVLVGTLTASDTSIRVLWPTVEGDKEAHLNVSRARQLQSRLKEVQVDEIGHYYVGELDSADKRKGKFGFTTEDGTLFDGVVEEHLLPELKTFFGRVCRAYIVTRTVTQTSTGGRKQQHRLQELLDLDQVRSLL